MIVEEAAAWVRKYFHETGCFSCFFHNYEHTRNTVAAGHEIAAGMQVSSEDLETVLLACWFHDIEWPHSYKNHEKRSAETAADFLEKHGAGERKISAVKACILATKTPPQPVTLLEKIICDADVSHLGMGNYYERNLLLRQELEVYLGKTYNDAEWLILNRDFFQKHHYFTSYARKLYNGQKTRNLKIFVKMMEKDIVASPGCGQTGLM